jgi:hypothetical protein
MIARVRAPGRFDSGGACSSVTGAVACSKCARRARFEERGSHGSINSRRGKGEPFTSALSARCSLLLASALERRTPLRFA